MILSQSYIYFRDGTIHQVFEYGYKCSTFMESIVSSWKYDSVFKSMEFTIHDYNFIVTGYSDESVCVSISDSDGFISAIQSKALVFCVTEECVMIICGREIHRYHYV